MWYINTEVTIYPFAFCREGNAVDKLVAKLEVPAPWEAHEVIYAIKE